MRLIVQAQANRQHLRLGEPHYVIPAADRCTHTLHSIQRDPVARNIAVSALFLIAANCTGNVSNKLR